MDTQRKTWRSLDVAWDGINRSHVFAAKRVVHVIICIHYNVVRLQGVAGHSYVHEFVALVSSVSVDA